ncbi:MAG: lipopolysaccharide biosynthesis protein [Pseudomonadota bacterium]
MSEAASTAPAGSARGFFRSVGSLISARVFLVLAQFIALPVIARHLAVEDFAIMAMAMSVVIFGSMLSDAGLGQSLIRSKSEDPAEWSSAFWLLVAVGCGLAALIIAISPVWAWFFDTEELIAVMAALSLIPLCQALAAAPNAEMERREQYSTIAAIQMVTTVASVGLGIGLALAGFGVWALVAQQVALAAVRLAGVALLTRFRPRFYFSLGLLGEHLRFARDAIAVSGITAIQNQSTVIVIGRLLGEGPLGLFAMNQRFVNLPKSGLAGPVSSVVYVRMAKARDEPARVVDIYVAAIRLLSHVMFPVVAVIAAAGPAVFTVVLSEKWRDVATIFAFSVPGMMFEAVTIMCLSALFRAMGRTELLLRFIAEGAVLRILIVLPAAFISLEAVAVSLTIWGVVFVLRGWVYAGRCVALDLGRCLGAVAVPAAVGAAFAALHMLLLSSIEVGNLEEMAIAAIGAPLAVAVAALLNHRMIRHDITRFRA